VKNQILIWTIVACIGGPLISNPARAQLIPPAKKAAHVEISQGPEIESAKANEVIIRWTSNNPGGSDEHFGVVHYGKSATDLSQTAKSHIRLNQGHIETVFRVRVEGLESPHHLLLQSRLPASRRHQRRSNQPGKQIRHALNPTRAPLGVVASTQSSQRKHSSVCCG
jgi:hypothetical protein